MSNVLNQSWHVAQRYETSVKMWILNSIKCWDWDINDHLNYNWSLKSYLRCHWKKKMFRVTWKSYSCVQVTKPLIRTLSLSFFLSLTWQLLLSYLYSVCPTNSLSQDALWSPASRPGHYSDLLGLNSTLRKAAAKKALKLALGFLKLQFEGHPLGRSRAFMCALVSPLITLPLSCSRLSYCLSSAVLPVEKHESFVKLCQHVT